MIYILFTLAVPYQQNQSTYIAVPIYEAGVQLTLRNVFLFQIYSVLFGHLVLSCAWFSGYLSTVSTLSNYSVNLIYAYFSMHGILGFTLLFFLVLLQNVVRQCLSQICSRNITKKTCVINRGRVGEKLTDADDKPSVADGVVIIVWSLVRHQPKRGSYHHMLERSLDHDFIFFCITMCQK